MAYNAAEMKEYRKKIRDEVIAMLGGKCARCPSTHDLQLDHIDRATKSFNIGSNWTRARKATAGELSKCQLLCRDCHIRKTREEVTGFPDRRHGDYSTYIHGKCRCDACKEANSAYLAKYRARKRVGMVMGETNSL